MEPLTWEAFLSVPPKQRKALDLHPREVPKVKPTVRVRDRSFSVGLKRRKAA